MTAYANIAEAASARTRLSAELAKHLATSKATEASLRAQIAAADQAVAISAAGMDLEQIAAAEAVLEVRGLYRLGGEDRASVLRDAIAEISTGDKGTTYRSLWHSYFGTKDYEHWHGQRCDCQYGLGPSHGSIVFSVGLQRSIRAREMEVLTDAERIACVYYLTNIEAIQAQRAQVAA
ncbi:hypothetical protein [Stenotrophomonas sp. B2]|uniref:hypothetical protein n=1 Tax=Stenotrophomonas sp. B2 TaxID=1537778 RepID=UPI001873914B|nr:hypothetical protein [Stenotrophomonas sp. B2]MBE5272147.1 hypothetical protein [Stenotrophomonas sp. B2]